VSSLYVWQGAPAKEKEFLLAAKARAADFPQIAAAIREMHTYQIPEIIALPILTLDAAYLDWARQATERAAG